MYVGGRTIKSYGWENHYIAKIKQARANQLVHMKKVIFIRLIGTSFFQNGGLLVAIAVLIPQWLRGEKLKEGVSMAMMAMVYYIFISVNMMTYVAMNAVATFLATIERMSTVYSLDEYEDQRSVDVEHKDVKVQMENCDFSWGFKIK
jgi:heme/copper-type cytochrome/quinol oxidase subunit 2